MAERRCLGIKWAVTFASLQDILLRFAYVFKHPNFKALNAHLTDNEYHALVDPVLADPSNRGHPLWPANKPVWPAHKPCSSKYVQLRVVKAKVLVNTMMAAYKYKYCSPLGHTQEEGQEWLCKMLASGWQVSHLMGGFVGCQLDMNPNNLVVEPVWQNHERKGCALGWAKSQSCQAERRRNKLKHNPKLELECSHMMEVLELSLIHI
jgi:hypothetical protein